MSGHNKWSSIKFKKAKMDAQRGRVFTKLIREITIAARIGGGDPDGNPRLRSAVQSAREANMPIDNVKKAILKGTGELQGVSYDEFTYEGYGPGGCAVLIEVTTDNKNRTASEVRHIFSKSGGSLGENGCVSWIFETKGVIIIKKAGLSEEQIFEIIAEAGAEDYNILDENYEILCLPNELENVRQSLEKQGCVVESAALSKIAKEEMPVDSIVAAKMIKLVDTLEDNDDVQNVYTNFQPPEDFELE